MKILQLLPVLLLSCLSAFAQVELTYYLPQNVEYDPSIPTPESVIGHQVGEWHVTHDKLVMYMQELARTSDRVSLEVYGHSHEDRPLLLLTITDPENQGNIGEIKNQRQEMMLNPSQDQEGPAVVWMGFSVHGNEASGSNASLLTAYYLAAARGPRIEAQLKHAVILMDPCINPDGLQRFSTWVNSNRSMTLVSDPNNREQNEFWPRGRTNHYWFDLNRDWVFAQHPETRGRLKKLHEWKPNVVTDHHEMGTNSTFFFQPGIPSRNNPLTPRETYTLTNRIAEYHAAALDSIGSLYYSKESFDDFYIGKGATYPDLLGGVGILFEQASVRGHKQESIHGEITFPFAIRNQFNTSLSTLEAAYAMRKDLNDHLREFYSSAGKEASEAGLKAYIVGDQYDKGRLYHFLDMLSQHQIRSYEVTKDVEVGGQSFKQGKSYVVPLDQPNFRLIKGLFETRTAFTDSLFYDISTWTLPLAFHLDYAELDARQLSRVSRDSESAQAVFPEGRVAGESNYAYLMDWNGYYAPRALNALLQKGYTIKVAHQEFSTGDRSFDRGTLIIPVRGQPSDAATLKSDLAETAKENGVDFFAVKSGNTLGVNLGSPSFRKVNEPSVMMLVEDNVSNYEAGEIWHLLDYRYNMPLSLVPVRVFNRIDLSRYNTILLVSGSYSSMSGAARDRLKTWIANGGTLMAFKRAGKWLSDQGIQKLNYKKVLPDTTQLDLSYGELSAATGAKLLSGAIFQATLDNTHPLSFGMHKSTIPVFRNSRLFLETEGKPFFNPMVYTGDPLLSGYVSQDNLDALRSTAGIGVYHQGRGRIIVYTDDHNFRSFWFGTNRLIMNGIFFSDGIRNPSRRFE